MKSFCNKKFYRVNFVLLLAVAVLSVFSGCDTFQNILGSVAEQSSQSSAPKATAPVNNTGRTLYGLDSIEDESVRVMYGQIEKYAYSRLESVFTVDGELSSRQLYEGICAYKEDHPEVFWLKNSCKVYYENGSTYISLNFLMNYQTRLNAQSEFEAKVSEIAANAPSDATQFELEQYAHDYIIDNCEYDFEAAEMDEIEDKASSAYGALVEGKAICEGYSRAFKLLCNELGIECVNIFGTDDDENHMWNGVKIEDEWYQVDVTWDDNEGEQENITRYLYFNLDDEKMYKDHQASDLYENISDEEFENTTENCNIYVPQCSSTEYNYHLYYGSLITDIDDSSRIVSGIAQAAKENRDLYYLTADSSLDLNEVSSQLMEDGYIAEWISSANLENFYSPNLNAETNVYTISEYNLFILELQYI